jgi:ribosomal protein S18 acetylase RimI-like enzyme
VNKLLLPGYWLRTGSGLDRLLLVKFMQQTYQELYPTESTHHLAQTVDRYFSGETPLFWVETENLLEDHSVSSLLTHPLPQPVGCLWLGNAVDQIKGDRHTHIFLLYITPPHRRQGLGSAMMTYAEAWAKERGDRQIGLQVFQSNQPALNLYTKLGYQPQSISMMKSLD